MLYSNITVENAARYKADKMFFSVASVYEDGKVGTSGVYSLMHRTMMNNSDKVFLLVDHDKINCPVKEFFADLNDVDYIISDYKFPGETKKKYKNTKFIEVNCNSADRCP